MKSLIILILFASINISLSQNIVSTYSGDGTAGLIDGDRVNARFNGPFGICRDSQGNLYVADGDNHCIRIIDKGGIVSIFAGIDTPGYQDGPRLDARFNSPTNICIDDAGNLYVSDFLNHRIRKISSSGKVTTVAGSGIDGFIDGADTTAQFNYPRGITIDASGNIYVADSWNHRIRKIDAATNFVSTYAGGGMNIGVGSTGSLIDGADSIARFYTPSGLTMDNLGNLFVADPFNHRIRLIDMTGEVFTLAGSGAIGPGAGGYKDGAALSSRFNTPTDLFRTANGDLLIGDTFGNRIRKLDGTFQVSTIAGNGVQGFTDDIDSLAEMNFPRGITSNIAADTIYFVDHNNHAIRMITAFVISGNSDIDEDRGIMVAPNPTDKRIQIHMKKPHGNLKIFNIIGTLVLRTEIENTNMEIDVSQLKSGSYILTIENEKLFSTILTIY